MTKLTFPFSAVLMLLLFLGCQSLYDSAVTITQVDDIAMRDWAAASKAGRTSPKIDASVKVAQEKFKTACNVAADALESYKTSGDNGKYLAAIRAARTAANEVLDLILPLLTPEAGTKLQTNLQKANKL